MQHFLLTRFNLKINGIDASTNTVWLADRFHLFEKFCLPSVLSQTNHNFIWIFFFDKDTPEPFRTKALSLTSVSDKIKILFIDGFKELNTNHSTLISPYITDKYIITTRLDNDDIIHQDFIETIQKLALLKHNQVIDLRKGYQMIQQNERYSFRLLTNQFNAFISVVEDSSMYKTVLSREHPQWRTERNIVIHNKKRLWIEFVHSKNITNAVRSYIPSVYRINFHDFALKKLNVTSNKMVIAIINIIKAPLFLAFALYKEIKFKLLQ